MHIVKKRQNNNHPDPLFRFKSCKGKKKYMSESDALAMLDIQREYGKEMDEVHAYRCEFCNKWHLGHRFKD